MNFKINNIENSSKNYTPKKAALPAKQEQKSETKEYTQLSSNPKYYQAIHNISFGSSQKADEVLYIKDKGDNIFIFEKMPFSNKPFPIKIDNDVVSEYLVDSNDEISPKYLKEFKEIFLTILKSDIEANQNDYQMYSEISESINEKKENFYGECGEDAFDVENWDDDTREYYEKIIEENKSKTTKATLDALSEYQGDDNAFAMRIMKSMPEENQREFAQMIAQFHKNRPFDDIRREAIEKTANIFFLSKTEDGYDLSDLEKKTKISNKMQYIKHNWNEETYEIIEKVFKDIREKNGKFKIDSISSFIDVISAIDGLPADDKETYNQLQKFYNLFDKYGTDKSNTADLLIFTGKYFDIENENFEEYFSRAFDKETKEFNKDLAQKFVNICKTTREITEKKSMEDEEGKTKLADIKYSIETEQNIIDEYYNKFFDFEKWNFTNNTMPPKDFVETAIKKYL